MQGKNFTKKEKVKFYIVLFDLELIPYVFNSMWLTLFGLIFLQVQAVNIHLFIFNLGFCYFYKENTFTSTFHMTFISIHIKLPCKENVI